MQNGCGIDLDHSLDSPAGGLVRRKYPLITVNKFDLNLRKLTLVDEARPSDVPPVVVSDLRFLAPKLIVAPGDNAANRPATEFTFSREGERHHRFDRRQNFAGAVRG